MSNDKSCDVIMEVPTKKQEFKELLIEASIHALREGCNHILQRISSHNNNSNSLGLTIDSSRVQIASSDQCPDEPNEKE